MMINTRSPKCLKEREIDMDHCGIDTANKTSAICVLDGKGRIVWEGQCTTDEAGFSRALRSFSTLRCVVEASPLSEWVAQLLEALGHEVIVIDPRKAKALIATKKKTDRLDARNLARMSLTGWYTEVHRKSAAARLLRSQLKARLGLVKMLREQENRLRGLLRAHGVLVGSVSRGQFEARVKEVAQRRCAELMPMLEMLLEVRHQTRVALAKLTKELKRNAKLDPLCRLLMTAPGVGSIVAAAYVATIDEPRRFRRSAQAAAYVGLAPRVYQSAETEYRGRISKEGDHLLRWLLVEAAHVLLTRTRRDSALKRWGQRLADRKGLAKARVAVARKLAVVLHRMWLTGQPFNAEPATAAETATCAAGTKHRPRQRSRRTVAVDTVYAGGARVPRNDLPASASA
jgi:transposase